MRNLLPFAPLSRAGVGPATLLLEGEPGIGKSALWLAGVEHARQRGSPVLMSRPGRGEALGAAVANWELQRYFLATDAEDG
jgi:hypothetical protein